MNTAFVKIWGELVGAVAWNPQLGMAGFEYDNRFKEFKWELSPLKMPLSSNQKVFAFPELRQSKNAEFDTFRGLPGLLADILPDKYGNQLIHTWLAQQGRAQDDMNPVEVLCFIGRRGMGALEFEPTTLEAGQQSFTVDMDELVAIAQKLLSDKMSFHVDLHEGEKAVTEILKIGTSAGGARPKAVIAYNPITNEVRSGQTNAPEGFEHWLIKLDGVSDVQLGNTKGYGRVEMAYYQMATDCGIGMMPSQLLEENGRAHFMTKRFDREGSHIKRHVQTFCGIQHFDFNLVNSFSYEQLFQTMRALRLSYADAEQMFRRMAFNVMARNCDDHTKNFAFMLKKDGLWELAPAYDICHAYKPDHRWVSQHALSINGKRKEITLEDLLAVAKSISLKRPMDVLDEIRETVRNWSKYADMQAVEPALRDEIEKTLLII